MSNGNQQNPAQRPMTPPTAPPPRPPHGMEPIPVRELRFGAEQNVPLQGADGGQRQIRAGENRRLGGMWIEIQYEPWQRHHRVREYDGQGGTLTSEFCVPESWAVYIPAAG